MALANAEPILRCINFHCVFFVLTFLLLHARFSCLPKNEQMLPKPMKGTNEEQNAMDEGITMPKLSKNSRTFFDGI